MSGRGYEILSLDELDRYPAMNGAPILMPVRRRLGVRAFGVNCWTAPAVGEHVIERHREPGGDEELYAVVRGRATFTVEDETIDAPPGTLVHVPPNTMREATMAEEGTLVLAVGARPGEPFEPAGWEDFQIAFATARAGSLEAARELIAATIDARPGAWQGRYNAACFEVLQGNRDAAFDHLRAALELSRDDVRKYAVDGDDLAPLREDPRWAELLG